MPTSNCKIRQVEIYQSRIKLKEPFKISLGTSEFAENIYLVIRTNTGIIGYGECSPDLVIQGENMDTCFIFGRLIAEHLIGENPLEIEECHTIMDSLIYGNSSIKSAFDMALYDIVAQNSSLPLYAFLGGSKGKTLVTDYTISLDKPGKMVEDAFRLKEAGFPVIKVKLGTSEEADMNRIRLIRQSIGDDLPLRLDANQGWNTQTAIAILSNLKDDKIQFCEEPIPRWNFMELPLVRQRSTIPIMADESCCDSHDAKRLVIMSACNYFNVKLGKSSGIMDAIKIIRLSEKSGFNLQMGGFIESRLGFTAAAHLSLISNYIIFYDFDTPLMMEEDPILGGIKYGINGKVEVPDEPGLGATVDEKYLKRLEKIVIK